MYRITALKRIDQPYKNRVELNLTFDKLCQFLTTPRKGEKKIELPAFSPAIFRGHRLTNPNVFSISCMVFDIDDGLLFEEHHNFEPFQYIAYTSPSHSVTHHKWRLVLPLDEPIRGEYWPYVWDFFNEYFEHKMKSHLSGGLDISCKDQRRFYFLGKESREFEYYVNDSGYTFWVNMPEILERKAEREEAQRKALEAQKAKLKKMVNKPLRNRDTYNELRMQLNTNVDYRRTLAQRLGATITGGANPRAVNWECPNPSCGRSDCTFFYLNPLGNKLGAFCMHKKSCNWSGGLFDLARLKGMF